MKYRFEADEDDIDRVMEFLKYGCPTPPLVSGGSDRDRRSSSSSRMSSWEGVCFSGLRWCKYFIELKYIKAISEENPSLIGDITNFLEEGCRTTTTTTPTTTTPILILPGLTKSSVYSDKSDI